MSRCSSMPATASPSPAPTICCRSTPTSNPKWTSSSAPPSISTSRSTRPWATPRSSWCSSTPAATTRSPPRSSRTPRPAASRCRPGLAEMKSGEGTLIAFATGPGQTALDGQEGHNSPFTRALIANITQPGVEIQQAMTKVRAQVNEETNKGQLPWGHTNLIGAVYLNPAAAPTAPAAAAAAAPAAGAGRARQRRRAGVLALDQGLQQAGRAQRLSDQLSERPVQVAGAVAHRLAGERHAEGRARTPAARP